MKVTGFLLILSLLFGGLVYGQTITMSLSTTDVDINETVRVSLEILGSSGNGSVTLDGVQAFDIVNQATADNVHVVNGERTQTTTMTLDLKPKQTGPLILGPAHLNVVGQGRVASSNKIDMTISGEKLFVGNTPQGRSATTPVTTNSAQDVLPEDVGGSTDFPRHRLLYGLVAAFVVIILMQLLKRSKKRPPEINEEEQQRDIKQVIHTYNKKLFIPQSTTMTDKDTLEKHAALLQEVMDEVGKTVVGQTTLIRNLLIALIAQGHILLEGVPGLAKTLSVETLAKVTGIGFGRVQFTPDLLPSDLTGTKVFNQKSMEFITKKGPIFTNLLLADEINRAPAKVQSALLEAMAEKQVTIGDDRQKLDDPFVVMATQNPLEQEGTYSLPEAQLDRFLLKTVIGYPTEEEEIMIMKQETGLGTAKLAKVLNKKNIAMLQASATAVTVADGIYTYVKNLVVATREPMDNNCGDVAEYISYGVSPRASLALIKAAKVLALMDGRSYVLPEDIKEIAHDVLRHRIIVSFQAIADGVTTDSIIDTLLERIPVVA